MKPLYRRSLDPSSINSEILIGHRPDSGDPIEIDVRHNVLIAGPRRSGTTTLMQAITDRLLDCPDAVLWVYDPTGDLGPFIGPTGDGGYHTDRIDWYTSVEADLKRMIESARLVVEARRELHDTPTGADWFAPSTAEPAVVLLLNLSEIYSSNGDPELRQDVLSALGNLADASNAYGVYIVREQLPYAKLPQYCTRIVLNPDEQTSRDITDGDTTDAAQFAAQLDAGPGVGLIRKPWGTEPIHTEFYTPDLMVSATRPCGPVHLDDPAMTALATSAYPDRWEPFAARIDPGYINAFLMQKVVESAGGGQSRVALAEALADRRGDRQDHTCLSQVDEWIDEQLAAGTIVRHRDHTAFVVAAEFAEPAVPVLATFNLPAGTPLTALATLLTAVASTRTGKGHATTVGDVVFESSGTNLSVTIFGHPAE